MQCFDDITAVLFVVAISEYDQVLFEDEQTVRLLACCKYRLLLPTDRFFRIECMSP